MNETFDFVIIGSGPAGVSVARPLLEQGRTVLMIDAGLVSEVPPPSQKYLEARASDEKQWQWMVGKNFHALRNQSAVSPKLRVPTQEFSFKGFSSANKVIADEFVAVGSLALGGLSNSWGCGVARFSDSHLKKFPCDLREIDDSYRVVAERMGISGSLVKDDLSEYFGLDKWSKGSIELDRNHKKLYENYKKHKESIQKTGVSIGRSRVAVLTEDNGNRKACNVSGNCLWGCSRGSLYTAAQELTQLRNSLGFTYKNGKVATKIKKSNCGNWNIIVENIATKEKESIKAPNLILAAGTLASTRLALGTIEYKESRPLLSCPTAAFLLWQAPFLGQPIQRSFGLGQLSYSVELDEGTKGFGSTFSPTGIAVTEFIKHLPLSTRNSVRFMRKIISSCVIGNFFLPGELTDAQVILDKSMRLVVKGSHKSDVGRYMNQGIRKLKKTFFKMGAIVLPGSFNIGSPGSDIHYAGTLPMKKEPELGETNKWGELFGAKNLYIVDGACLPVLSEKSHTLTIMANADRIGRYLASLEQKN